MRIVWLVLICLIVTEINQSAFGEDWNRFLGPDRNGKSVEKGLIDSLPDEPDVKWRTFVNRGMAGLAVVGKRLVTLDQDRTDQYVTCLNTDDGTEVWRKRIAGRYENSMGNGPRSTPTIVDGKVFVTTGDAVAACLKLKDGEVIWKRNLLEAVFDKIEKRESTRTSVNEYGTSVSPLIVGDLAIFSGGVTEGQPVGTLIALNQTDGKLAWSSIGNPPSYSSPTLMESNGKKEIVVFDGGGLLSVELKSGKANWYHDFQTEYNCNVAVPLLYKNKIFISAGENHGCQLFDPSTKKVSWESLGKSSVMKNEWQTSIIDGDFAYGFSNDGSAGPITNLHCLNLKTGELAWRKRRYGKGNMLAADGKLFIQLMEGELILAEINSKEYRELGVVKIFKNKATRQSPALADGKLYMRGTSEIVCIDVKKK